MRPGSPPACVTPTYFQSHQGAQGTDTTDREEKRNTSKMLFLKVKMTLKFLSNYGGNMSLHKTQITGRGKEKQTHMHLYNLKYFMLHISNIQIWFWTMLTISKVIFISSRLSYKDNYYMYEF